MQFGNSDCVSGYPPSPVTCTSTTPPPPTAETGADLSGAFVAIPLFAVVGVAAIAAAARRKLSR
jgi:hypothetical protein